MYLTDAKIIKRPEIKFSNFLTIRQKFYKYTHKHKKQNVVKSQSRYFENVIVL